MSPPAHVTRFSWRGATVVVETAGTGTRTFVLVHGIGMGRRVFAELAAELATRGQVMAIDLPGYGDAPEPPRVLTVERNADVVAALLRDLAHPDVTLVGHSMGAQVVAEIVARHPLVARRAVLAGPSVDPRERRAWMQIARLVQDIAIESPEVWARGAREYLRAGPHLRAKFRAMLIHRLEKTLPRVTVPALVLRGTDDKVASRAWCREVVELLPDASLVEIDARGHETMIRDAEPAATLIARFAEDH